MSSIFIDTLGCFKNLEDSERAAGILEAAGHVITDSPKDADVIIVNTCGFIEDAKRESIGRVLELAEARRRGARLIVTGCLTQRYPKEIFAEIPEADAVLGVNDYDALPSIIDGLTGDARGGTDGADGRGAARRIIRADGSPAILTGPRRRLERSATAYLKVAEGCDNRCAYCAIPAIRGPYRSVPMKTLADEAASLVAGGARELVLIAQDVSAYGKDIYSRYALPELLEKLCTLPSFRTSAHRARDPESTLWLRLLYCYGERVTGELINAIATLPGVCHYIDIPLQHVSGSVLRRMGRRQTRADIERTLEKLRTAVPDIAIRTTMMTGFPGETDRDFDELMDFVSEQRFDRLGVFAYSDEDGTRAAQMPDKVPREVAEERRDAIMRRQLDISLENNRRHIGKVLDVLAESREEDAWVGRTEYDAPEIDGAVIFTAPTGGGARDVSADDIIGTFVKVRITDAMDYDLVGEMI